MSDEVASTLFPALEIAAFGRGPDGGFASISPVPAWFARLVDDTTFPFLGHILEEAIQFWNSGTSGFQEFGPCAEVDQAGREFHYKVLAVSTPERQFLLFMRDPGTDRMRGVLQKAREQALRADDDARVKTLLGLLQAEARTTAVEIRELAAKLRRGRPSAEELAILEDIAARCDRLDRVASIDTSPTLSAD
jgi:hypothetical protein